HNASFFLAGVQRSTTLTDFSERRGAIDKFTAVGLRAPDRNLLSQLGQAQLFQILTLFEKPQALAQNLALRLIEARLEQVADKLIEYGAKIDVHSITVPQLTAIVNY